MKSGKQKLAEKNTRKVLEYNTAMRNMSKYEQNLRSVIKKQEAAAVRYENGGHHGNAVECARTIRGLCSTADKMHAMQEKLEMVYTMRGVGSALTSFTKICNGMMTDMGPSLSAASITKTAAAMEQADLQMQMMMDSLDVPAGIDDVTSYDEEGESCLEELLKENQKKNRSRISDITDKVLGSKA